MMEIACGQKYDESWVRGELSIAYSSKSGLIPASLSLICPHHIVIPAKAGTQVWPFIAVIMRAWVPAFAEMTVKD